MTIDHREFLPVSNWIQALPEITSRAVDAALSSPDASDSSRKRRRAIFHSLLAVLLKTSKCAMAGTGGPGAGGLSDYSAHLRSALPGIAHYNGDTALTWHHLALEKARDFLNAVSMALSNSADEMLSPVPRFDQLADKSWEPSNDQNQAIRGLVAKWKTFDAKRISVEVASERMFYVTKFGLLDLPAGTFAPADVKPPETVDDVLTAALQNMGISTAHPLTDVQKRQVIFAWWKDCGHVSGGPAALRDEWNRRGLLPELPANDLSNSKQTLTRGRVLVDAMRASAKQKKLARGKNVPGCTR
ncbi:MAG TPA: hypothetical protein VMP01_08905 [Pirellulaceae bacterium]|nr:hypothetical protein [Pirellulaceae bacterium]